MKITGTYDKAWTPYRPNLDGSSNQRLERFQAFRTALQAGNLAEAQGAFTAFQKDIQKGIQNLVNGGPPSRHAEASKDLQAMGEALAAGDIAAARQAFTALKQDLQALYSQRTHSPAKSEAAEAARPEQAPREASGGNALNTYA